MRDGLNKMFLEMRELTVTWDTAIVLSVAGVLVLLLLVFALVSFIQERKDRYNETLLQKGFSGRMEKIERNLNDLRADVLRAVELLRSDMRHSQVSAVLSDSVVQSEADEPAEVVAAVADREPEPPPSQPAVLEREIKSETLASRLKKTRMGFLGKLTEIFAVNGQLDSEMLDQLEELMIAADLGVRLATELTEQLRAEIKLGAKLDQSEIIARLKQKLLAILISDRGVTGELEVIKPEDGPFVILLVGVNGVGKTTSAAKLAGHFKALGQKVLLVAADTYRAAAVQQLSQWGNRIGVPVVTGQDSAKPATVVFDAMKRAIADQVDLVIIDTAGRLHNKSNLMQELSGVKNAISRHQPSGPHQVLLVLDGTTGQNAITQAKEFNQAVAVTGLIITKLDGTPKGGAVVAVKEELGIPVCYIGVGETQYDLQPFVATDFVEALFSTTDLSNGELVELSAAARQLRKSRVA